MFRNRWAELGPGRIGGYAAYQGGIPNFLVGVAVGANPPTVPAGNALTIATPARPAVGQVVQARIVIQNTSAFPITIQNLVPNIINPSNNTVVGYLILTAGAIPVTIAPGATAAITMQTTGVQARQSFTGQPQFLNVVYEITADGALFVFSSINAIELPVGVPAVTVTETTFIPV